MRLTSSEFFSLCMMCYKLVVERAPKDTYNLAYNAVKMEFQGENICRIYVDLDIGPYMPFTNEEWIAERWHGKKNPNEHWFDDVVKEIAELIAKETKGRLKHD